jgi:hypothetical protein
MPISKPLSGIDESRRFRDVGCDASLGVGFHDIVCPIAVADYHLWIV